MNRRLISDLLSQRPDRVRDRSTASGVFLHKLVAYRAWGRVVVSCAGMMALMCCQADPCRAQLAPPELKGDPYVAVLQSYVEQWNDRSVRYRPPEVLRKQFVLRLDDAVARRPFGYETPEWREKRLSQFDELDQFRVPMMKIDEDAVRTLNLALSINLPTIRKRYKPDEFRNEMQLPTYILFVSSQRHAEMAGSETITAKSIIESIFDWWTTVFPFCAPSS